MSKKRHIIGSDVFDSTAALRGQLLRFLQSEEKRILVFRPGV
jgi:hypothetical protein